MSVYVIGDLQGCLEPLERLLSTLPLRKRDQLWFVGDVVNRGPHSLESLRLIKSLGDRATVVMGNHDLHLLCVAEGATHLRPGDTLNAILEAPDREELLRWIRCRPLLHQDQGVTLIHAGLLPQWTVEQAASLAREVEEVLQGAQYGDFPDSPPFDGLIANILTNPLVVLAPLLLNQLKTGGWLTLSGILSSQVERVQNAYAPDCLLSIVGEREGWVCLGGVKQVY